MVLSGMVAGVDIGGTTTAIGIVDRRGKLLCESTLQTLPIQPAETLVPRICGAIEGLLQIVEPVGSIAAIGVGAPNANYLKGTVENPVNLRWGASVNIVELFRQQYDLPVAITNDANAAAIGEHLFGAARGMKHALVITIGTGLGSGFIVNGKLLYGADGNAGELGHTTVDPAGRECACGKRGCLETYVSAAGICRTAVELLEKNGCGSSLNGSTAAITSKEVHEAALRGDCVALSAFDATARILGMKLADAVAHTSPEGIFIAGGVAAAGDLLLLPTRRYLEEFLFTPFKGKVKLGLTELPAGKSGVLGAAALAWRELYPRATSTATS